MRSTLFTRVNIDSALSPANYASGCATEITYTVYLAARIIFAAKNTHAVTYVPQLEYAKSIQLPSQLRLRSLEPSSILSILKLPSASVVSKLLSPGRSNTKALTFIAMKNSHSTFVRADARLVVISVHFRSGMFNKNMKPATDLCHVHGGPSMAQKGIALS